MNELSKKAKALLEKLIKQENPEQIYGLRFDPMEIPSQDEGYGDPHEDTRPDFVKKDSEGWTPLR